MGLISSSDESKIFSHDGAVFIAKDGTILATTPTTLLILNDRMGGEINYRQTFGEVSDLIEPQISEGTDAKHADLRDETIKDGIKKLKLEITLSPKFSIAVIPDLLDSPD